MSVALVHYHLQPGGVTRVLEAQSRALTRGGISHVILAGTPCQGPADLPVAVVPGLDYRTEAGTDSGASLAAELRKAARIALRGAPHCWHLHNPTIGKNILYPALVEELAAGNEPLVLHFHDFAEDGRPSNYELLRGTTNLYPIAPQIRYAFINSRDQRLLIGAGVPAPLTTLLPNAVTPPPQETGIAPVPPDADPLVLYPVRGIRRKNVGELCLLAALARGKARFALTLAPENPEWRPVYDQWVESVAQLELPVGMGVVGNVAPSPQGPSTYGNWLAHASHLVTTSIAEGFGLAFLEPLALGKPLLGRDLPEITVDFKQAGRTLGNLYERLLVPASWVDEHRLATSLREQLRRVYHSYGRVLPNGIVKKTHELLVINDHLDFGNLPESLQREVLSRALLSPQEIMISREQGLQSACQWLEDGLGQSQPPRDSGALEAYSIQTYGERHLTLYQDLARAAPALPGWLDPQQILDQFLQPERFHFLRT